MSSALIPLVDFGTILLGILFVALPFVVVGVAISNVIQRFISRERLLSLYGRSFWRNYLVSITAGFVFPLCECGIVPVARGLSKKGVPTSGIVMFLLSAPVLNPITAGATIAAFPATPSIWLWRLAISQFLTLALGWIFQAFTDAAGKPIPLLKDDTPAFDCVHPHGRSALLAFLTSCYEDLMEVFPYILLGASITSFLQAIIPKSVFFSIGDRPFLAIALFMCFAFVLSVCSSVDAFVILPFASRIHVSALLAFLSYGPLIDIKNILLYRAYFTRSFRRWYLGLVTLLVGLSSCLVWYVSHLNIRV